MKRFGIVEIVDRRPRSHGPGIVELPVERTHVVRLGRAVGLDGHLHAVCLRELAQIDIVFEGLGLDGREITLDEIVDLSRATGMFLMRCDDLGVFRKRFPLGYLL